MRLHHIREVQREDYARTGGLPDSMKTADPGRDPDGKKIVLPDQENLDYHHQNGFFPISLPGLRRKIQEEQYYLLDIHRKGREISEAGQLV